MSQLLMSFIGILNVRIQIKWRREYDMNIIDSIFDTETRPISKSGINKLRAKTLKTYRKLGETNESINAINGLAEQYFEHFKQSHYYLNRYKKIVREAVTRGDYQRFHLLDDGLVKMSLHVMPKGTQIPMHAHPDMFSVTLVDQGVLKIKKDSWGRLTALNPRSSSLDYSTLNSGQASTGLPIKNNLHQIQAGSDGTVFISLRVKLSSKENLLERLFTKENVAISGLLMGFAIPFVFLTGTATSASLSEHSYNKNHDKSYVKNPGNRNTKNDSKDYSKLVLASEKEQFYAEKGLKDHRIATKFRNSSNYENQVEAVKYYEKSARRGDAESQYWLGVMFLDGSGITEDDDLALDWISKSAAQNYPPAEQLLAHLLATNFDMER